MNVIRAATELTPSSQRVCLAIGFFDGVHLGHQQIIRQTITDARQHQALALVLTFDQHPCSIVAPDRVPPLLYSLSQRLRTIASLGADTLLLLHFDEALSRQTGAEFVRGLARDLTRIQSLCVGANFLFGHQRSGDVTLLRRLGAELGFLVHGLAAVALDGETVSSTRIRQAVLAGDLDAASQMLGRAYALAGRVVQGDGIGRQLGFPTANLDTNGLVLPPNGVYLVQTNAGGKSYPALLNIGFRPTLQRSQKPLRVEAHLIDFDGDLYGQELEIAFVQKIRDEIHFASIDQLRRRISEDLALARSRL